MLSGISCCAVVCSVPVVADAAPFSSLELSSDCSSGSCGSRSGCDHFASRASGPSCVPMLSHSAAASRMRLGRNCMPIRLSNVRSAGPPMRVRGATSHEAVRYAEYAPCPHATRRHPPSLHQGKQILQRLHGLLLLRSVRERHLGDVHRAGHGIRIDGLRLTDLLLHGIHVDGDATRVFAQQRLEAGISHGTEANSLACASSCSAR